MDTILETRRDFVKCGCKNQRAETAWCILLPKAVKDAPQVSYQPLEMVLAYLRNSIISSPNCLVFTFMVLNSMDRMLPRFPQSQMQGPAAQ